MYSKGKSSNYSWLTILPRKIQKRFKRNRQKVEESASVNDIFDETSTEPQEIPAPSPSLPSTFDDDNTQADQQATRACEEMKKELFKLACYWPKLTRIEAQQLLR